MKTKMIATSISALPTVDETRQNEQHRMRKRKRWNVDRDDDDLNGCEIGLGTLHKQHAQNEIHG